MITPEHIRHIAVELDKAGADALEYAVEVDVDGAAAPQRILLQHAISRYLVEACNEYGWTIPFPQLVVHQMDRVGCGQKVQGRCLW